MGSKIVMGFGFAATLTLVVMTFAANDAARLEKTDFDVDWAAVNKWPPQRPDTTFSAREGTEDKVILVMDDSGSMADIMDRVVEAAIEGLGQFDQSTIVGLTSLNRGVLVAPATLRDNDAEIIDQLRSLPADGGTPLGTALSLARAQLEDVARQDRGYGTYRILVLTDGRAEPSAEEMLMRQAVDQMVRTTPILIQTIGLGIGNGHTLNIEGVTQYRSADDPARVGEFMASFQPEAAEFKPVTFKGDF